MTRILPALGVLLLAAPVTAQHQEHEGHTPPAEEPSADPHGGHHPHAGHEEAAKADDGAVVEREQAIAVPPGAAPPAAYSGMAHAADGLFDPQAMAESRRQLRLEEGAMRTGMLLADRIEFQSGDERDSYVWDVQAWYGSDLDKLWIKTEAEGNRDGRMEHVELQALYSRAITPFFDAQLGIRHDPRPDPDRSYLVAGVQGLLPYVFELDAALFLSDRGELAGRLEGEYDLQLSQRAILQPRFELEFSADDVPELRIASGFSSVEAGVRLRYEVRREFAPYAGIAWSARLGDTADFARAAGEDAAEWAVMVGVRAWF